jgi:hypothetical protein
MIRNLSSSSNCSVIIEPGQFNFQIMTNNTDPRVMNGANINSNKKKQVRRKFTVEVCCD